MNGTEPVGIAEEWRTVKDFPDYEVSSHGRVRSKRPRNGKGGPAAGWRYLGSKYKHSGYWHVSVFDENGKRRDAMIHVLVLEAFVGPCPSGLQACHFPDRSKDNNRLDNLRWDTPKGNAADRRKHGTQVTGELSHLAKLTAPGVLAIRRAYREGEPAASIAERHGISETYVYMLARRVQWAHLPEQAPESTLSGVK